MAANFGDTIIEGGIAPSVAVQAPVQDDSGAVLAQALAPAARAVGAIAGSIFEGNQQNKKAGVLSELNSKWLDYADAVDQGAMTQAQARMLIRRDFRESTANDPTLYEDINKLHASFITASGMGHIIDEGTIEQQAQDDVTKAAITAGYPDVQSYRDHLQAGNNLAALNQRVETLKAQGSLVSETELNEARTMATNFTRTGFPWAQTRINDAMKQIELHPDQKAEIASQLNTEIMNQVNQIDALTGPLKAEYITTPIKGLLETFNGFANGTVEANVMTGAITNTKLQLDLMYRSDPEVADFISRYSILKDVGLESQGALLFNSESIKKLFDNASPDKPPANFVDGTDTSTVTLQNIRDAAGRAATGDDPEVKSDIATQINNVIDGVYVNERAVNDPVNFRETVEFLGSPQVKEFINANGGIGAKFAPAAQGIIKDQYEQALLPVINDRWLSTVPISDPLVNGATGVGVVGGIQNLPMSELLVPHWNGNAVEFTPAPGYESNPRVLALASETNSGPNSIATPLNNLINAYSTLTGEDAGKVYEEQFASRVFNAGKEDIAAREETNSGASREVEDFNSEDLKGTFGSVDSFINQGSVLDATDVPLLDPAQVGDIGVDFASYLPAIRSSESGGNDSATNPTSTATGRYQFLKSTWNDLVNKYPNSGLTYDGRGDPQQQEAAIRIFTANNANYLKTRGVDVNNGNLYAAHFLGAGDAATVLKAPGSALVSDYVPARVVNANNFLKGMTVAKFKAWASRKGN